MVRFSTGGMPVFCTPNIAVYLLDFFDKHLVPDSTWSFLHEFLFWLKTKITFCLKADEREHFQVQHLGNDLMN